MGFFRQNLSGYYKYPYLAILAEELFEISGSGRGGQTAYPQVATTSATSQFLRPCDQSENVISS